MMATSSSPTSWAASSKCACAAAAEPRACTRRPFDTPPTVHSAIREATCLNDCRRAGRAPANPGRTYDPPCPAKAGFFLELPLAAQAATMTITEIRTHPIAIPYAETRWTAHEALERSSTILVEVRTDQDITGIGQIHAGPMAEVCKWVERLGEVARGLDPCGQGDVWQTLFALTCPRPGAVPAREGAIAPLPRGARPQIMAAIAGIDIALWDIRGKAAGMPVYRLLGAEKRPVFVYATGGY